MNSPLPDNQKIKNARQQFDSKVKELFLPRKTKTYLKIPSVLIDPYGHLMISGTNFSTYELHMIAEYYEDFVNDTLEWLVP